LTSQCRGITTSSGITDFPGGKKAPNFVAAYQEEIVLSSPPFRNFWVIPLFLEIHGTPNGSSGSTNIAQRIFPMISSIVKQNLCSSRNIIGAAVCSPAVFPWLGERSKD
jgi:hypothetical protein